MTMKAQSTFRSVLSVLAKGLALPFLFDLYQGAVGATGAKRRFVQEWLRPESGERLLDIGCGTGAVVPFLPSDVDVVGIDIDEPYIVAAKSKHGHLARFVVGDCADHTLDLGGAFDRAYAFGVLHHLPDAVARRMLEGVMQRLRPGGLFVAIDPVFIDGQSAMSRFVVANDRGRFVRTVPELADLFGDGSPKIEIRTDLLRIPFAAAITTMRRPA